MSKFTLTFTLSLFSFRWIIKIDDILDKVKS